jgi:hypothetical protein
VAGAPPKPESFYFSIDNSYQTEHPKLYISCFLFYEAIDSYYKLKEEFNSVLHNKDESVFLKIAKSPLPKIDKCYTSNSHRKYSSETPGIEKASISSTKAFKFNSLLNSYDNIHFIKYYAPKVICLISFSPFHWEHLKILKTIYKFTQNKRKVKKPIEKILENLFFEVPNPPRGIYQVEYNLLDEKLILTQPEINRLPLASIDFNKIFMLPIEQVLEIYKHLILEEKILIFSSDKQILSSFIEGFINLLYPFTYSFPYCAILPLVNLPIIENFNSFFFGINTKYNHGSFFKDYNLNIEHLNIIIVDLDCNCIINRTPDADLKTLSLNRRPWIKEDIDLPKVYRNKLYDSLQNYFKEIKQHSGKIEERDVFIKTIREIFFIFMVSIIQDYSKYIATEDEVERIGKLFCSSIIHESRKYLDLSIFNIFRVDEYISNEVSNDRHFYKKFLETRMFFSFILKKLFPKDNKEKLEILYLDEAIIEHIYNERIFSKKVYRDLF